jgi:hypothetical protein
MGQRLIQMGEGELDRLALEERRDGSPKDWWKDGLVRLWKMSPLLAKAE